MGRGGGGGRAGTGEGEWGAAVVPALLMGPLW